MKLAFSSNAYMRHSIAEASDRIAALGYEGIELMADAPHAWPAETTDRAIDSIRDRLQRHNLTLSNVNAFTMNVVQDFWHPSWIEPDPDYRQLRIQHTKRALSMAGRLGAPSITTEPGGPSVKGMSRGEALDIFVDGLRQVLGHAEDESVSLLVEPEPGLLIENVDQFLELAQRIDSPMFGLNFDIGHFYCVNESLPRAVEELRGFTRHYHIEDIAATRTHEHLIPGHGAIDLAAVLRAIHATGYDGWITVELYPYQDAPDTAGREARDYLIPLLPS